MWPPCVRWQPPRHRSSSSGGARISNATAAAAAAAAVAAGGGGEGGGGGGDGDGRGKDWYKIYNLHIIKPIWRRNLWETEREEGREAKPRVTFMFSDLYLTRVCPSYRSAVAVAFHSIEVRVMHCLPPPSHYVFFV